MIHFPLIDTHLHLWDPTHLRYPWLAAHAQLNQPYLLEDFQRASAGVPVEQMVFLQCGCDPAQFMEEVHWVVERSRQDARLTGMVPWAPLHQGDAARADLERLAALPLVKGVRCAIEFAAGEESGLHPAFLQGVRALAGYGLHFEMDVRHDQLARIRQLVRLCPDTHFVLDHCAKPEIKQQRFEPWRQDLRSLADLPNICCKISGLVTAADHQNWTPSDLRPYIEHVLECFGFERVMYGSDWPVATQASDYPRWVETLEGVVQGCSEAEMRRLFHDNARVFYRLT